MKTNQLFSCVLILGSLLIAPTLRADEAPATQSAASTEDAAYTRTIEGRANEIIKLLDMSDTAKTDRVRTTIMNQYRALRDWQAENEKLAKDATQDQKDAHKAQRKALHDAYLARLAEDLSPEQIEKVKDKMVYGKVEFTFKGYQLEYPSMNEEQKAKVLDFLKQAREEAMDGGSSKEKDNIFNKYKGKINNYLSKQGVEGKKKAATSKPAVPTTQPEK